MCIIEKNQEIHSKKTLTQFSLKLLKKYHDTIQRLKNVVHYLNMKTKETLVEIIDLQLCSSLK